jgi:hypothetical protein
MYMYNLIVKSILHFESKICELHSPTFYYHLSTIKDIGGHRDYYK